MLQSLSRFLPLFHDTHEKELKLCQKCCNRSRVSFPFSTKIAHATLKVVNMLQSLSRFLPLFHSALPRMASEAASDSGLRGRRQFCRFWASVRSSGCEYTRLRWHLQVLEKLIGPLPLFLRGSERGTTTTSCLANLTDFIIDRWPLNILSVRRQHPQG